MNLRFYIICIAAALMFAAPATAADSPATIHGVVYGWDTFEPLDNAVVEVNSTPSQSMVAKYGVYSFELAPGAYTIKAGYYQNGTLSYSAEEPITVESEGNYVLDLLLLPVYSEELMDSQSSETGELSEIPETETESQSSGVETAEPDSASESEANSEAEAESEVDTEEDEISASESAASASSSLNTTHLLAAFMLVLLLVGGYRFSQKQKSGEKKSAQEEKTGERQIHSRVSVASPEPEPAVGQVAKPETKAAAEPVAETATEPEAESTVDPEVEQALELVEEHESDVPERKVPAGAEEKDKEKDSIPEIKEAEEPGEESDDEPEEKEDSSTPKKPLPLPADLQEVMDIIRGQGGRITQKELRSRLKYSEGKVSLMLTDLERRGLVEKFKRGRGNVVIIKEGER